MVRKQNSAKIIQNTRNGLDNWRGMKSYKEEKGNIKDFTA